MKLQYQSSFCGYLQKNRLILWNSVIANNGCPGSGKESYDFKRVLYDEKRTFVLGFLLNLPISHTAGYKIRLIIEYKSKKIATNIILIINFLHSDIILYIIVYNILGNRKDKILKNNAK